MKFRYIYLLLILIGVIATGCQNDFDDRIRVEKPTSESETVVTLSTARNDGVINLSVDAPALDRFGVWIDLDGNGERSKDGSEDVKVFNVYQEYVLESGMKVVDLYGDITYLAAASNELTGVDISGNPFLKTLNVPLNKLSAVDLSSNTALERLDVSGNNIAKLDVSANRALESLWVYNNELSSLDVSNNTNLTFLDSSGNSLTSLDVSNNSELNRLLAYNNQLVTIDLTKNAKLHRLWLFGNQITESETEQLVNSLNSVANGELWITDEPLNENTTVAAMQKGWEIL